MSDDYEDYETGPFCRHWTNPPSDCEEVCAACGHLCWKHQIGDPASAMLMIVNAKRGLMRKTNETNDRKRTS